MKYTISILLLALLLGACTSSEIAKVNYYLLDKAGAGIEATSPAQKEKVLVSEVRLANYLKKSNIPIQLANHQLYYSREHLWAEPLPLAIKRTLVNDLNKNSQKNHFITGQHPNSENITRKVIVQFDHFITTDRSKVIASGKYWLVAGNEQTQTMEYSFNMDKTLRLDGYPHAVSQLRHILFSLSEEIATRVSESDTI